MDGGDDVVDFAEQQFILDVEVHFPTTKGKHLPASVHVALASLIRLNIQTKCPCILIRQWKLAAYRYGQKSTNRDAKPEVQTHTEIHGDG